MTAQTSIFDRGRAHAADHRTSKRLQAVLDVLNDGGWHTSYEIAMRARVLNPAGAVSELKAPVNMLKIETEEVASAETGRRVFRYRMVK